MTPPLARSGCGARGPARGRAVAQDRAFLSTTVAGAHPTASGGPDRLRATVTITLAAILLSMPAAGLRGCACAGSAADSASGPPAADSALAGLNLKPSFRVPRVADGIRTDGELDEQQWREAARLSGFTQWNPDNLARPPVDTEVLVAYDSGHLRVGFIAHDDPKALRSSLRDRDQIFQDDFVGLFLDPTGDGSWAYELWSNPQGVQGDLLWTPETEDSRLDIVFESEGRITGSGYQVEMAIPFSSLRFPSRPGQTWRVNFWRSRPRGTRGQYSWAALRRGEPCWQCQWGTMTGIENVRPSRNLELLPSLTAAHASALRDPDQPSSGLDGADLDADLGLNLRYVLASNLAAEAAINPDFSQIEADAAQVDVNSTFALFYPEKRPFFQEGMDLFQTDLQAVYSRSVNDPSAAGRLTGRANRTSFAYIGAVDEHSPFLVPFAEQSAVLQGGRSVTNIARVRQTFGADSKAGLVLTDRRHADGGSGTAVGADGALRFLRTLRLVWQAVTTHTREPVDSALSADLAGETFDRGRHTAGFDGESFWGHGVSADLRRDGRVWNLSAEYVEKSPTFRVENGFETQNDVRRASVWTGFDLWLRDSFFTLITPNVSLARVWDFDGLRKDEWLRPELYAQFKGQTEAWVAYLWSNERFRGGEFDGIRRLESWGLSRFSDPVSAGWSVRAGRFIARNLDEPVLGRGASVEVWGTIKPARRLVVEPKYQYSVLRHPDTGGTIFEGYILRVRSQYQFTRELSLRLVVQYDGFDDALQVDPLLSYKVSPFTVAYAGSAHSYRGDGPGEGFQPTGRQLFLKLQYLFRI